LKFNESHKILLGPLSIIFAFDKNCLACLSNAH
jgi:hypothetical protein